MNWNWSYSPETPNSGQNLRFFVSCDLEGWWMTLKNNRAPLLIYFKLCASLRSHWWIQTGVTVQKRPIQVKIWDFFSRVTLKFDGWPWKTIRHLFYATSSYEHHFFYPSVDSIRSYGPEKPKLGQNLLWPRWTWPLILNFCMDITFFTSRKFHDHAMRGIF